MKIAAALLTFLLATAQVSLAESIPIKEDAPQASVPIAVGPYKDTAVIDTGSTITSLDFDSLALLAVEGKAQLVAMRRVVFADGTSEASPLYRISELTIGKCKLHPQGGFVVRGGDQALLGLDILSSLGPWVLTPKEFDFICPR